MHKYTGGSGIWQLGVNFNNTSKFKSYAEQSKAKKKIKLKKEAYLLY